jgi:hypothetical protein
MRLRASPLLLLLHCVSARWVPPCPQERAAKAAVQLPYVHQGAGRGIDYAGDARQYLPPAAGGFGPGVSGVAAGGAVGGGGGASKLGHILYVRDSDEEHDSDEDPDDDLDV